MPNASDIPSGVAKSLPDLCERLFVSGGKSGTCMLPNGHAGPCSDDSWAPFWQKVRDAYTRPGIRIGRKP